MKPFNIYLLFVLATGLGVFCQAKDLGEQLYEETHGVHCDEASSKEVKTLSCHLNSNLDLETFDKTSEALIFKEIGSSELAHLQCTKAETRRLLENKELKTKAVQTSCSNLEKLIDIQKNIRSLEKWIKSYKSVSDRSIRTISREDSARYHNILKDLQTRLVLYRQNETGIRLNDPLFRSSRFWERFKDLESPGLMSSGKNKDEICKTMESEVDGILKKDLDDHTKSAGVLKDHVENPQKLIENENLKRQIWGSESRSNLVLQLNSDASLSKSVLCRMEGRYGKGAELADRFKLLLSIGAGGLVGATSKLASLAWMKRANDARKLALITAGIESTAGVAISANQISDSCKDQLSSRSGKNACQASSDSEFKNLYYEQLDSNQCISASINAAFLMGLSAIGAKSLVFPSKAKALQSELISAEEETTRILQSEMNRFEVKSPRSMLNPTVAEMTTKRNLDQVVLAERRLMGNLKDASPEQRKELLKELVDTAENNLSEAGYTVKKIEGADGPKLQILSMPGTAGKFQRRYERMDPSIKFEYDPAKIEGNVGSGAQFNGPAHTMEFDAASLAVTGQGNLKILKHELRHGRNYAQLNEGNINDSHGWLAFSDKAPRRNLGIYELDFQVDENMVYSSQQLDSLKALKKLKAEVDSKGFQGVDIEKKWESAERMIRDAEQEKVLVMGTNRAIKESMDSIKKSWSGVSPKATKSTEGVQYEWKGSSGSVNMEFFNHERLGPNGVIGVTFPSARMGKAITGESDFIAVPVPKNMLQRFEADPELARTYVTQHLNKISSSAQQRADSVMSRHSEWESISEELKKTFTEARNKKMKTSN